MNRFRRAALAMVCAVLPAAAMSIGRFALFAIMCLLVAGFSFGWPFFADVAHPWTAAGLLAVVGAAGITVVALSPSQADVGWLIAVLALAVVAVFIREIVHHEHKSAFINGIVAMSVGIAALAGMVAWLGVSGSIAPIPLAWIASAVACCVGGVACIFPLGSGEDLVARVSVGVAGVVAGGAAGLIGVAVAGWGSMTRGLLVGVLVGAAVSVVFWAVRPHIVLRVAAPIDRGDFALAVLPMLVVGLPLWGACLALS